MLMRAGRGGIDKFSEKLCKGKKRRETRVTRFARYSRLTGARTRCSAVGPNGAERSGLLSRQVVPTRGGARKTNRDTPGHRNAIASLAMKLLPSETTSRRLRISISTGNITSASRCERYSRPGASFDYICRVARSLPFFFFTLS